MIAISAKHLKYSGRKQELQKPGGLFDPGGADPGSGTLTGPERLICLPATWAKAKWNLQRLQRRPEALVASYFRISILELWPSG